MVNYLEKFLIDFEWKDIDSLILALDAQGGGSFEELLSDTTGYHFSIKKRDVMVLTGMLTVPEERDK